MSSRLCSQIRKIMQILIGKKRFRAATVLAGARGAKNRPHNGRGGSRCEGATLRATLGALGVGWRRASGGRGLGRTARRGGGADKLGRWRGVFGAGLSIKITLTPGLRGRVGGVAGAAQDGVEPLRLG